MLLNTQISVEEWYNRGVALDKMGKNEEAIECYDKVIKLEPKYSNAWNNKGNALSRQGLSLELLKKECVEANKEVTLAQQRKYEEAIKCYDTAIELDPKNGYTWDSKGLTLSLLHRYEETIECYNKALEFNYTYAYGWNNKGRALSKLHRYEEAIECYNKALELNPDDKWAEMNKEEALKALEK